jgi:type VI secretion system protein ImpI
MEQSHQLSLNMVVTNVQLLDSGLTPQSAWTPDGGMIGASSECVWRLKDKNQTIEPHHCEVRVVDGAYCLLDHSGETYVNGASMPIGKGQFARLKHKDEIQIGPYLVRVYLGEYIEKEVASNNVLEQFFNDGSHDLLGDDPLEIQAPGFGNVDDIADDIVVTDPLLVLEEPQVDDREDSQNLIEGKETQTDDELAEAVLLSSDEYHQHSPQYTQQEDGEYDVTSSIGLKRIFRLDRFKIGRKSSSESESRTVGRSNKDQVNQDKANQNKANQNKTMPDNHEVKKSHMTNNQSEGYGMDENALDLLEEEVAKSMVSHPEQPAGERVGKGKHVLTGPLLDGLGADFLNSDDMEKMHFLSEEFGQSLQACIKGLLALHHQLDHGRFEMMNRNLQPIEDNPLRLGLSYEETVQTMYDSDKSRVHLSAPSAIAESLKNVQDHNDAVQHATSEALKQILAAFAPQVLLRRFNHYRRTNDQLHGSEEAWAWDMYCSYYEELTSNRQQGFEKLFWEIFEQAYDKKIREKQLES